MQTDKDTCLYNNSLRKVENSDLQHMGKSVSKVVIHTYFKNHLAPEISEGFLEIIKVPYIENA